jgi:hypothetical protein
MSNRREFLQGATLTALPLAAGLSYQAGADVRAPLALGAVLIDERLGERQYEPFVTAMSPSSG